MNNPSEASLPSEEFNKAYKSIFYWVWTDIRIPKELKELEKTKPTTSLELGCGLGRFSSFMAKQGVQATGVDFSSVAIEKAKKRTVKYKQRPTFLVGDVTNLEMFEEAFDTSFDVGCFHCLDKAKQEKYVCELYRILKPGGIHLLWALDSTPSNMKLNPDYVEKVFANGFSLIKSKPNRRRIIASHWYWLVRDNKI